MWPLCSPPKLNPWRSISSITCRSPTEVRAKLGQDAGRGFVGRAVRAIHNDAQAFERHAARERRFGVFDVTAQRVVDAHRFADGVGGRADIFDLAAEYQVFNFVLDAVVEFV